MISRTAEDSYIRCGHSYVLNAASTTNYALESKYRSKAYGGFMRKVLAGLAILMDIVVGRPTYATENLTYTYDALGRLVNSANSGSINSGQTTAISFDAAGNRTSYSITGTSAGTATLTIGNASVTEGATLVFTVTRSGLTTSAVGASWTTVNGTAVAGSDFTAGTGVVSFAVGETTKTVSVATINDAAAEATESMSVSLSAPTGGAALGTPATGTGTILDNDVATATFAIAGASANEGSPLTFVVTRSGNTASAVSVNYATANGSALAGANYTGTSGTLSFSSGVTSNNIIVNTINDNVVTSALSMAVNLSSPSSGATISTGSATGTINNINTGSWSSTMTAVQWSSGMSPILYTNRGYQSSPWPFGSMSNTNYNGYSIIALYSYGVGTASLGIKLTMSGGVTPPNSGWTSITIPGIGTLLRANATYTLSGTNATWSWSGPNTVTSGAVTIQ